MAEKDFRIVNREELDAAKWDRLIIRSPNGKIFCTSWYLDATADNWEAMVWGDYDMGMPLPYTKKYGFKILYLPFFVRELDVFTGSSPDYSIISRVLRTIPSEYKLIRIGFSEHKGVDLTGFDVERLEYQELDLEDEYESLRASYSKNTKRLLNKSEKAGVQLKELDDVHVVSEMFHESKGAEVGELKEKDFVTLNKLMDTCLAHDMGRGFGAYMSGELIATGFFMGFKDRIIYLKGAATERGREYGGMYSIMDQVIREYAGEGMIFDFGGSRVPGVRQFNRKFGSTDAFYLFLTQNKLPGIVKLAGKIRKRI